MQIPTDTRRSGQVDNINVFDSAEPGLICLFLNGPADAQTRADLTPEQSKQLRKALKAAEKAAEA